MSEEGKQASQQSTHGKRDKEYERSNGNASLSKGEMNVRRMELVEENVPVRAFVSIVRRTKRVITKLENLLPSLRVRVC